jgi:hypothetical protein
MRETLLQLAYMQKERLQPKSGLIGRDTMPLAVEALFSDKRVLVVTGMRRTGKSTLVQQLMHETGSFCYFNFEEEKMLGFKAEDFGQLEEALLEVYGHADTCFFDEIQNIPNFETAIRRLQDSGKKIVITGSNAALLSMEFGSKLTGRYKQIELFPFSFGEYLKFNKVSYETKDFYLPEQKLALRRQFSQWMEQGGLPEYLLYNDQEYVRTLFDNILYRDIIVRYGIRRHREFRELVQLLVSNLTLPVTFSSLQKSLGLSNSETVKEYMGYLSNSYMFYEVFQYHDSLRKQIQNPRKVYVNDVAFHTMAGFSNSQNLGRKLENAVYLALRRTTTQVFTYKGKSECDFIVFDTNRNATTFQVCYSINTENETREMKGLLEAMDRFGLANGTMLTFDQEFEKQINGKSISAIPVWKWLLLNQKA